MTAGGQVPRLASYAWSKQEPRAVEVTCKVLLNCYQHVTQPLFGVDIMSP